MTQNYTANYDWLARNGAEFSGSKAGVSAYVVSVDKDMANALLSFNFERQRSIRPSYVRRLKEHLSAGTFMQGSPIRVCSRRGQYVLTDGQHRLTAIAEANARADFVVTFVESEPDIDYSIVDTVGMLRSLADTLAALDRSERLPDSKSSLALYASALRVISLDFSSGNTEKFTAKSRHSFYDFACEFEDAINVCSEHLRGGELHKSGKAYMRAGVLAVALVVAKSVSVEMFKNFWTESIKDDGLRRHDPRKKLHEELRFPQAKGVGGQRQVVDATAAAKCWNAFVDSNEIHTLRKDTGMVKIKLTDYPLRLNKKVEVS